jgi:hypothetical protein
MTNEYKSWLERMIEQCYDDKNLQREHWAFCQALKRYRQEEEVQLPQQETLYTEEQVREALFFALNVNRTTCCTTRTTDSIVRETIQSLNVSKGNATTDFDKPFIDFAKQYFKTKK